MRTLLSSRPRIAVAVVAVLAMIAAIVLIARPGPAAAAIRSEQETISAPGGPGVPGTVQLDATMYLPSTLPAPAVIVAHGFGGSKASIASDATDLAAHGFVALAYSARGFGASTGQIALDSLDYEVPDARALVDWLATRPEVIQDKPGDPRVGVTGASYGGALSLLLAGTDPRVDANVPVITWNDLAQSLFPNRAESATGSGGSLGAATPAAAVAGADGVFKKSWAASLVASVTSGNALSGSTGSTAPTDNGDSGFSRGAGTSTGAQTDGVASAVAPPVSRTAAGGGTAPGAAAGCGRLMSALCAAYGQVAQTGRLSPALAALLARSSPKAVAGDITAPTLLVQGERDTLFGLDQSDANARAIAARGTPVAVTWYRGGHDGYSPDQVTRNRMTGWLGYYLGPNRPARPAAGGSSVTAAAPSRAFVYSVDGPLGDNGRARSRTLEAANYPGIGSGAVDRRALPLDGPEQVVVNPPGGSPAGISSLPGLSGLAGSALAAFAGGLPGQTARFRTAPMDTLAVMAGTPRVTVAVTALPTSAGTGGTVSIVLFASVSKVTATGTSTLAGGAVAPLRVDVPIDGTPHPITVDLPSVAFQVEAGARLQVNLSTTDQAYAGPTAPAAYRISLAGDRSLTIPEVGGIRVSAGEVPTATLIALIVIAMALLAALLLAGRVRRPRNAPANAPSGNGDPRVPLIISGLGKSYPGGVAAVRDVSFRVEAGQVLGLLGPNGAGKTTTLRMVMGLITPTAGSILVFGRPVRPGAEILSRIGSFVEGSGFLPHLSGRVNLELYWRATGRPVADAHLAQALEIAGLGGAVNRRVKTYSQGMRQRLAIAQSMLGFPDLLLLDEPTNGLDPPQIHAMREVLRRYAATGRTVLISSHLLSEVEQTCSHVVVVNQGRTIAAGTVADLVSGSGDTVVGVDDVAAAIEVLSALPGVREVFDDSTGVRSSDADQAAGRGRAGAVRVDLGTLPPEHAVSALVRAGIAVRTIAPRNRLEDVFLELVGATGSDPAVASPLVGATAGTR